MTVKPFELVIRAEDYQQITPEQIRDKMKDEARKLAIGEIESTPLNIKGIAEYCTDEKFYLKLTPQYVRMVMSRVPEVIERGRIAIKTERDEESNSPVYIITMKRGVKPKKVFNESDLPRLERSWRDRLIEQLLKTQPNVTDLEGDMLLGAIEGIKRFMAVLESYKSEEA